MTLYFDMDGTIADLYGVENWLAYLQKKDPFPYENARPLVNMTSLARILNRLQKQGYEIGIISWLAKNSTEKYDDAVKFYHEHGLYHDEITILEKLERYDELLELYENLLKHEDFDVKSEEGYLCEIIKVLDKLEKLDKKTYALGKI